MSDKVTLVDGWKTALVEHVYDVHPDGGQGLVAVIVRAAYARGYGDRAEFVSDPDHPLQAAVITRPAGHEVAPHAHHPRPTPAEPAPTQEVIVVRYGLVAVDFYACDGRRVGTEEVGAGDMLVLVTGGHGLRVIEDCSLFEVKMGPYRGRDADKYPLVTTWSPVR